MMKTGDRMKKWILVIVAIIIVGIINNKSEEVIIPKEAIRFRVIANSNEEEDQETKMFVRDNIQKHLYEDLKTTNNVEEAREKVNENMNKYNEIVKESLDKIDNKETYKLNYGNNYFPKKTYKGVTYKEGYYESLVVTLGNGMGDNWWCVLFPPLCLLEAEESKTEEVEYKFFIKELIDKYF